MTKKKQPPAKTDKTPKDHIRSWMLEGHSAQEIDHAARHYWPRTNLEKIKGEIYDELALVADADPETLTGWCLEAYRELYRRMVSTGDYSGAIRAVREIQNLIG